MPAECVDILFILAAQEGPLKELIRADEARRIGWVRLALDDALQDREDFTAHFTRLGDRELEEEHGNVTVDLVGLARVLTVVERQGCLRQLHLRVVLDQKLFGHFSLFRNFESPLDAEHKVDQSHDQRVFGVEGEHLQEHLACVDFFQSLQGLE